MFDVAIIGAGPAGTAAAYDLLESGLKILLLDKCEFPRKKACAGGITPKGFNAFAYDISSQIKQVCNTVRITTPDNKKFNIKSEKPLCYMVDRKRLDHYSLKKVVEKGAVFTQVKKIKTIADHSSYLEIQTESENFKTRYLIGADGANSIVRKYAVKKPYFSKQMAIEADVTVDSPDMYPMEFDFSKKIKGYYWIFPKDDHVNIGIYSVGSGIKFSSQLLADYAFERFGTRDLDDVKGYPICTNGFAYRINSNRVFLVGDAAGMGERMLGEGIYFAVKTGRLAARAIVESQKTGIPAKNIYSKHLKNIQRTLKLHDMGSRFLYHLTPLSLRILSIRFVHTFFANGYAKGKSLQDIICFFGLKK